MTSTEPPDSIGAATLDTDGTLRLQLRAEGPNGIIGDAVLVYPPNHPQYAEICRHLEQRGGPMQPGESRAVAPWPD